MFNKLFNLFKSKEEIKEPRPEYVYVVVEESHTRESTYAHILGVYEYEEEAESCLGCEECDMTKAIDKKVFPDSFPDTLTEEELTLQYPIEKGFYESFIASSTGCWMGWRIIKQRIEYGRYQSNF